MSEQEELRQRLVQIGDRMNAWGEYTISPGELTLWRWSEGPLALAAIVNKSLDPKSIDVMHINGEGRIVGCSPGLISWALERVRRHMILETLADV